MHSCPADGLPIFVSGTPVLTSGSEDWVALHSHHPGPLRLHAGHNVGTLEVMVVAEGSLAAVPPTALTRPITPKHLSHTQQQQLRVVFNEYQDMFSPVLQHTIETTGPPFHQPYCQQNPTVRREEAAQVQQMLVTGVICPSNSPWASAHGLPPL